MPFDYSQIWPWGLAALAVLLVYRRLRRNFGRQRLHTTRMAMRIGLLALLGVTLLLRMGLRSGTFLGAEAAGAALGVALGIWGARHTRYQRTDGTLYFVPHTYSGITVSLLLIGRLVYRFVELRQFSDPAAVGGGDPASMPSWAAMPNATTTLLLFVVIGYYVCYYGRVLWKSKHIAPEDLEAMTAPGKPAAAR
jgi:hypothetical protein